MPNSIVNGNSFWSKTTVSEILTQGPGSNANKSESSGIRDTCYKWYIMQMHKCILQMQATAIGKDNSNQADVPKNL